MNDLTDSNLPSSAFKAPALSDAVRRTLANTFLSVAVMLAITAAVSWAMIGQSLSLLATITLFIVALGLIFAVRAASRSAWGLVVLAVFSAVMGVLLGPALTSHLSVPDGASHVASALGLTAAVVFACSGYAISSRRDFSHLRVILFAGVIALLLAMVANMFLAIPALSLGLSVVGAILFTAWLLYDLSEVIQGRETNYIVASIGVYLSILNIFTSLLNVLGIGLSDD